MNLVLLTHPDFLGLQSQRRFAQMLRNAYLARGHCVTVRQPVERWRPRLPAWGAKWAGYIDQYVCFPAELQRSIASDPADTLYVVCDQALGPWLPQLAHRPHVVHCHDLIALRSALGEFPQHRTQWTGRIYQRYIRRGFRHARHFISVSHATRNDLERIGGVAPVISEVVHNGLNHPYRRLDAGAAERILAKAGHGEPNARFLLHVGGGQWYKNTVGVVHLYAAYATQDEAPLPLWLVGPPPDAELRDALARLPRGAEVRFLVSVETAVLEALYSRAEALIFPSLAEGFGWPILEAMACGCAVVTTGEPPMTEIGGDTLTYLPRLRAPVELERWARDGADELRRLLRRSDDDRELAIAAMRRRAAAFSEESAIEGYLAIYRRVLDWEGATRDHLRAVAIRSA